jgi:hypothetical protein
MRWWKAFDQKKKTLTTFCLFILFKSFFFFFSFSSSLTSPPAFKSPLAMFLFFVSQRRVKWDASRSWQQSVSSKSFALFILLANSEKQSIFMNIFATYIPHFTLICVLIFRVAIHNAQKNDFKVKAVLKCFDWKDVGRQISGVRVGRRQRSLLVVEFHFFPMKIYQSLAICPKRFLTSNWHSLSLPPSLPLSLVPSRQPLLTELI